MNEWMNVKIRNDTTFISVLPGTVYNKDTTRYLRAGSSLSPQSVSATNAACNTYSNVTYLASCWPTWTVEEGDMASCFFRSGPRTGPSGENMSPPTMGVQKGQQWSGVYVRRDIFFFFFLFSERADHRYSKARLQKVSRKCSKIWLRRANIN